MFTTGWEHGEFYFSSIPSPAIKNILDYDMDKQDEYIKKLNIPNNMKSALITHILQRKYFRILQTTIDNTLDEMDLQNLESPYSNEFCVFNNVDVNKYITKIVCTKKNYRKIKKYIPKNIEVVFI